VDRLRDGHHSTHAIGGNFGAAASAAAVLGLDKNLVRYVLSYTAQQASGVMYWVRDEEHVEKAFVFGGMPARNGVTAAILAG
jgi:2-methylcitrate dehydratase PrpD